MGASHAGPEAEAEVVADELGSSTDIHGVTDRHDYPHKLPVYPGALSDADGFPCR